MNKERRKQIDKAIGLINEAKAVLEEARDDEQGYLDEMPESLHSSDKGEKAAEAISEIDSVIDDLERAEVALETAKE